MAPLEVRNQKDNTGELGEVTLDLHWRHIAQISKLSELQTRLYKNASSNLKKLTFADWEVEVVCFFARAISTEWIFLPQLKKPLNLSSCSGLSVVQLVPVESLLSQLWYGLAELHQKNPAAQPVWWGPLWGYKSSHQDMRCTWVWWVWTCVTERHKGSYLYKVSNQSVWNKCMVIYKGSTKFPLSLPKYKHFFVFSSWYQTNQKLFLFLCSVSCRGAVEDGCSCRDPSVWEELLGHLLLSCQL